jgi:hypothetical protein
VFLYFFDSKGNLMAKDLPNVGVPALKETSTPDDSPAGSDNA